MSFPDIITTIVIMMMIHGAPVPPAQPPASRHMLNTLCSVWPLASPAGGRFVFVTAACGVPSSKVVTSHPRCLKCPSLSACPSVLCLGRRHLLFHSDSIHLNSIQFNSVPMLMSMFRAARQRGSADHAARRRQPGWWWWRRRGGSAWRLTCSGVRGRRRKRQVGFRSWRHFIPTVSVSLCIVLLLEVNCRDSCVWRSILV